MTTFRLYLIHRTPDGDFTRLSLQPLKDLDVETEDEALLTGNSQFPHYKTRLCVGPVFGPKEQ